MYPNICCLRQGCLLHLHKRLMANAILNFHFDYLNPSLRIWPHIHNHSWWDIFSPKPIFPLSLYNFSFFVIINSTDQSFFPGFPVALCANITTGHIKCSRPSEWSVKCIFWKERRVIKRIFIKDSSRYAKIQKFENNFLNLSILRCNFLLTNCAHVLQKS